MALVYPLQAQGVVTVTFYDARIWPFKGSQEDFELACSKLEERWHRDTSRPILKALTKTHQCGKCKGRWARHYQFGDRQTARVGNLAEAKAFIQQLRDVQFGLTSMTVGVKVQVMAGIDLSKRQDLWQPGEPITREFGPLSIVLTQMQPKDGVAKVLNELDAMGYQVRMPE